jgi:hypothetical protein
VTLIREGHARYRTEVRTVRYVANPRLAFEVARSLPVAELLTGRAEQVAAQARALARREAYQTGAYARSIEPASGIEPGGAVGCVNASDFKAGWIEFGTKRQPARAILRRAAEADGYRVTKGRR